MRFHALLLGAALTLCSSTAFADTITQSFTFSFTGDDTGSGTLTTQTTGTPGEYLITDISGSFNKATITSLLPVGSYPLFVNDNDLYYPAAKVSGTPGKSFLDQDGFSFSLSNGNDINIYYSGGYFIARGAFGLRTDDLTDFTVSPSAVSATPEPSSIAMLGTGLLSVAGVMRKRFRA